VKIKADIRVMLLQTKDCSKAFRSYKSKEVFTLTASGETWPADPLILDFISSRTVRKLIYVFNRKLICTAQDKIGVISNGQLE
jgi:hypothetical protein